MVILYIYIFVYFWWPGINKHINILWSIQHVLCNNTLKCCCHCFSKEMMHPGILASRYKWVLNTDTKNTPNLHFFIYDAQIKVFYFITELNHINSVKHVITSKEPFSQASLICNNLKSCCILTLRNLLQQLKSHNIQFHHCFFFILLYPVSEQIF